MDGVEGACLLAWKGFELHGYAQDYYSTTCHLLADRKTGHGVFEEGKNNGVEEKRKKGTPLILISRLNYSLGVFDQYLLTYDLNQ